MTRPSLKEVLLTGAGAALAVGGATLGAKALPKHKLIAELAGALVGALAGLALRALTTVQVLGLSGVTISSGETSTDDGSTGG